MNRGKHKTKHNKTNTMKYFLEGETEFDQRETKYIHIHTNITSFHKVPKPNTYSNNNGNNNNNCMNGLFYIAHPLPICISKAYHKRTFVLSETKKNNELIEISINVKCWNLKLSASIGRKLWKICSKMNFKLIREIDELKENLSLTLPLFWAHIRSIIVGMMNRCIKVFILLFCNVIRIIRMIFM